MIETKVLTPVNFQDFVDLMNTNPSSAGCMCTWWMIAVGNKAVFQAVLEQSPLGMGILAYDSGEPVGWLACGPRQRYARAMKTPTFQGRDPLEDGSVWLAPCFFVKTGRQHTGVTTTPWPWKVFLSVRGGPTSQATCRLALTSGHLSVK